MEFEINFCELNESNSGRTQFFTNFQKQKFTNHEIFDYLRDCSYEYYTFSVNGLIRLAAVNQDLIQVSLRVLNNNLDMIRAGLGAVTEKKIEESKLELAEFIKQYNQMQMLATVVIPYEKIAARRRG